MISRLLLLFYLIWWSECSLQSYDEGFVMKFINKSQSLDVSQECKDSLSRVWPYLNEHDTLDTQRNYFHESFASGPAWLFLSRDQDRWVHRGVECILAAGETIYSKSEHPMHYCYGTSEEKNAPTDAFSICIPSPCADDHKKLLDEWQSMAGEKGVQKQKFDYTTCSASRHKKQWFELPVPVGDFIFNAMLSLFIALATVFHHHRGEDVRGSGARLLLCFSLKKNIKKLTQMPKDPQAAITCLIGLRFIAMMWTLIGHSFIFIQAYLGNVDKFKDDMVDHFQNQWITNFTLSVDVFLTVGGCLVSYSFFRKWLKNTIEPEPTWNSYGYWMRFYRHRVVRLWPAYLYTIMAVTLRISVTHWHPMWPPTDPAIQCPIHWYENVFFINSLFNNRCMPWTWYIGTEFIYYLLSPIFLLSLRHSVTMGMSVSIATIAISSGLNTFSIIQNNFPPTQFLWRQPEIFNPNFIQHHIELYIKPQFRIGPYIVGILLGYYLANYQKSHIRGNKKPCRMPVKAERSRQHSVVGWTISVLCLFWSLYGLYPSLQGWDWPIYHLVYGSIHRVVFSVGLSWLIYACHTGLGGFVNSFLSFKYFVPLANLSYSAYLFHMIPVVLTYLLMPFPIIYNSQFYILFHCLIQLFISYVFAFICTMSAEYPALNIEQMLLYNTPKKASLKPVQTADSELQLKPPTPPPVKK